MARATSHPAITASGFMTEKWHLDGVCWSQTQFWNEDLIRYLGGLGYGDINMTFYRQASRTPCLHSIQTKVLR
ncbi:hypothetical protein O9992_18600 [Vibrio lentus]|nr:hypothetical protein [Vibrio lentus]